VALKMLDGIVVKIVSSNKPVQRIVYYFVTDTWAFVER
jgi:hypothetical protein